MKPELQQQLFESAPLLFGLAAAAPQWKIDATDDLYPFLAELVASIEKFDRRYSRRRGRVYRDARRHSGVCFQPSCSLHRKTGRYSASKHPRPLRGTCGNSSNGIRHPERERCHR